MKLFINFAKILYVVITGLILLMGFFVSSEIVDPLVIQNRYIHIDILLWVLVGAFIYFVSRMNKSKSFKVVNIFLFCLQIIFGIGLLFVFKIEPIYDSKSIIDVAKALLINEQAYIASFDELGNYLSIYPFQYGMVKVCIILATLFGIDHIVVSFQILNLIGYFTMLIYFLRINRLFDGYSSRRDFITLLITTVWFIPLIYVTYIYGFCLGLSLAVISIYYFLRYQLRSHKNVDLLLSLVILVLACIIKLNYLILFVAYILVIFCCSKQTIKKKVFLGLVTFFALVLANEGSSILLTMDYGLKSTQELPMTSFLVMSGVRVPENYVEGKDPIAGWHDSYNTNLMKIVNGDMDLYNQQVAKDGINQLSSMIDHPFYTLKYYAEKLLSTWTIKDFQSKFYLTNEGDKTLNYNNIVTSLNTGLLDYFFEYFTHFSYYIVILLLFIGGVCFFKSKDDRLFLFQLIFIGGFSYYFLFETKAVYVYPFIAMCIPLITLQLESINPLIISKKSIGIGAILIVCSIIFNLNQYRNELAYEVDNSGNIYPLITKNGEFVEFTIDIGNNKRISSVDLMSGGRFDDDTQLNVEVFSDGNLINWLGVNKENYTWRNDYLNLSFKDLKASGKNLTVRLSLIGPNSENFYIIGQDSNNSLIELNSYEENKSVIYKVYCLQKGNDYYHSGQKERIRIFG